MTDTQTKVAFSAETLEQIQKIIKRYPTGKQKSALLPILHIAQAQWKWLSPDVMDCVAEVLQLSPVEVYEVASFYTMFHLDPVGDHVIEFCRTGPCCVLGANDIKKHICDKLNIEVGGTSADNKFTLKEVECLAACGWGPVFQVREQFYMNLTTQRVDEILEELAKK
jgi:NADH-quinone oxidoreductase subunit E